VNESEDALSHALSLGVASRFLARLLAAEAVDFAEEYVINDKRLADGKPHGRVIAEELQREERHRAGKKVNFT